MMVIMMMILMMMMMPRQTQSALLLPVVFTSFGTCRQTETPHSEKNQVFFFYLRLRDAEVLRLAAICWGEKVGAGWGSSSSDLVDGEADGEEVGTHLALFPPVLLHQRHHEGAAHLVVLGVIVLLQQTEAVLRIGPERVCGTFSHKVFSLSTFINFSASCFFFLILWFSFVHFICFICFYLMCFLFLPFSSFILKDGHSQHSLALHFLPPLPYFLL